MIDSESPPSSFVVVYPLIKDRSCGASVVITQRKPLIPALFKWRGLEVGSKPNRKIIEINKILNQFTSSIKHKPLNDPIDQARILAFLKAVREVLAIGPPKHRPLDEPWKGTPVDEATLAENTRQLAAIRETIRKGFHSDE